MNRILNILVLGILSINLFSQDVSLDFSISQGGNEIDYGTAITTDINGNIIITGEFMGTVDFDPGPENSNLTSIASKDIFIQKLDSLGNLLWVRQIPSLNLAQADGDLVTDEGGNIYISGLFEGIVDFDLGPNIVELTMLDTLVDSFVLKLNSDGDFQWVIQSSGGISSPSIAVDNDGNVLITRGFIGTCEINLGSDTLYFEAEGEKDFILQKFDENGSLIWGKHYSCDSDTPGSITSNSICTNENGSVYVLGTISGVINFDLFPAGSVSIYSGATQSSFILNLDSYGNVEWAKKINDCFASSINIDINGNVLTTVHFGGSVDFDPGPDLTIFTSYYYYDVVVLKFNPYGEYIWAKHLNSEFASVGKVKSDLLGNVFVFGEYNGVTDFDPGLDSMNLNTGGFNDYGYVLKLNPYGGFVWAQSFNTDDQSHIKGFHIDDNRSVFVTGHYRNSSNFLIGTDSVIQSSNGNYDNFILKINQNLCSDIGIAIDDVVSIPCYGVGSVSCHAFGANGPYTYSWNTIPTTYTSDVNLEEGGIYTVTAIDSLGCNHELSILIDDNDYNGFDMDANLVSNNFRPGFSTNIIINAFNNNCILVEGSIKLVLDSLVSFENADIQPDLILGDTLIWNISQTNCDSSNIILNLETFTPTYAVIGDTVCFDLSISPINDDSDPTNNYKHYCHPIINGSDPNDKQVYPQGICDDHYVLKTDPLTYTIRFQNIGNAEAINIHIIDTLSSFLDINTLEILGSSHEMYVLVKPGNVVDFMFDDIWLPDSLSNEEDSHGYVIFKVHPNSFIYNGTYVDNKSEIYFDYNPPIVTNTVFNKLVNTLLTCDINMGIDEELLSVNDIMIYPNPSSGSITIEFESIQEVDITLYNLSGQIVYSHESIKSPSHQFEVDEPSGIYILEISTSKAKQYYKVVLE